MRNRPVERGGRRLPSATGGDAGRHGWLPALAATLLLAACASGPAVVPEPEAPPPEPVIVRPVVVAERAVDEMLVAMTLLQEGNLRQAEANLEEIVKVRPDIPEAHLNLGWVKHKLGRHAPAVEHLQAGLKLRPNEPRAYLLIGLAQREQAMFAEAEATFRQGLALQPVLDKLHLELGILYELYLFQPPAALEQYRRYQALQPAPDTRVAGWIAVLERQGAKP